VWCVLSSIVVEGGCILLVSLLILGIYCNCLCCFWICKLHDVYHSIFVVQSIFQRGRNTNTVCFLSRFNCVGCVQTDLCRLPVLLGSSDPPSDNVAPIADQIFVVASFWDSLNTILVRS